MLGPILRTLERYLEPERVVILVATGTHRVSTDAERLAMFGPRIAERYSIVDHDARDPDSLVDLGRMGDGVPVALNRRWLEADLRITTGLVEPHFFAGFSGGPKMVAPGLAGLDTVMHLHDVRRIGHPAATWGVIEGNPVHDDVRAIARATGVSFALDVLVNRDHEITHVFGGELFAMHAGACEAARADAMQQVDGLFEVAVTTNSGYPLDRNLYQCIKGISAAARVVRPGGTIVCAAECRDGLPDDGEYAEVLRSAASPAALLAAIEAGPPRPDQWQVQVQAVIQLQAGVVLVSEGVDDDRIRMAHMTPAADASEAARAALAAAGPDARLCVLPAGPLTVPYAR